MEYQNIAEHYKNVIIPSEFFNSLKPVKDTGLLLPEFYGILQVCFQKYEEEYPGEKVYITETYRSDALQKIYYENGKSRIRKNGMHHYGIAADVAFIIDGKFSYKGDYNLLRSIFAENGLAVLQWELGHVQYISVNEQSSLRREIMNVEL